MDLKLCMTGLQVFDSLDPCKIPIHHMQVFLFIAEKESCTYRDVENEFNLSNASVSRIAHSLGEDVRHRQTCLGLVDIYIDPKEGRRYRLRLTKKGISIKRTLEQIK